MANSYFQFKKFIIHQDQCAMKVGTDGVLLGAWVQVETAKQILDIGTGTGLIALMLAQRSHATITALEIDQSSAEQAQTNIFNSPWSDRIKVICMDFNKFETNQTFDVIVSNPPFFNNSLNSPKKSRTVARHTDSLSYNNLFAGIAPLLDNKGEVSIIIPADILNQIKEIAREYHLFPSRQLNIITKAGKVSKRALISFIFEENPYTIKEMFLEKERHQYSKEYIELTKDFYLNM
ncbi:MAG: methyltransferase [Bacteroides sp.]|nr:methyltransferase [Bacteroides sp.]